MPDDDNTPRARWRLFGGGERVSANKALLLLNPATWSVDLGTFSDRPEPDGGLWDLDHAARLDPADYRWYSYAGLPAELYLDWSYGSPARSRANYEAFRRRYQGAWVPPGSEAHPDKWAGLPCVPGTRLPVAQLLGELAEGRGLGELAAAFGVDRRLLADCLLGVAVGFSNPDAAPREV